MDHTYQSTMLMPASYAVLSEEEMTYLDGGAVKRGKGSVPPPCRDLFPELCAGCHPRSLPETFKQCL